MPEREKLPRTVFELCQGHRPWEPHGDWCRVDVRLDEIPREIWENVVVHADEAKVSVDVWVANALRKAVA